MINSVSFASTSGSSTNTFKDLVAKPQSYTAKSPAAISGLNDGQKTKKSLPKTVLKVGLLLAGAAALLAVGAKTGAFKINESGNKTLNKIKGHLNQAGEFILNKAASLKNMIFSHTNNTGKNNQQGVGLLGSESASVEYEILDQNNNSLGFFFP